MPDIKKIVCENTENRNYKNYDLHIMTLVMCGKQLHIFRPKYQFRLSRLWLEIGPGALNTDAHGYRLQLLEQIHIRVLA